MRKKCYKEFGRKCWDANGIKYIAYQKGKKKVLFSKMGRERCIEKREKKVLHGKREGRSVALQRRTQERRAFWTDA
jgi:hypothetical protein